MGLYRPGTERTVRSMHAARATSGHRRWVALAAASVAVIALASAAWACTSQCSLMLATTAGLPGSRSVVTAKDFEAGRTVEVRWGTANGRLLGTGTGPSFNYPVVIPTDATPGTYTVIAVLRDGAGQVQFSASDAFTVTGPAPSPTTEPPAQSATPTTEPVGVVAPTPSAQPSAPSTPSPAGSVAAAGAGVSTPVAAAAPGAAPVGNSEITRSGPAGASPANVTSGVPASRRSSPVPATEASAAPVAGQGVGVVATPSTAQTQPEEASGVVPDPSAVWSSLGSGQSVGLSGQKSKHGTSPLTVGAGVFTVFLIALFAGALVVASRRRAATS